MNNISPASEHIITIVDSAPAETTHPPKSRFSILKDLPWDKVVYAAMIVTTVLSRVNGFHNTQ